MRERFQQPRIQRRENKKKGAVYFAEWHEYIKQPDGTEIRQHRSEVLGLCRQVTKKEAQKELDRLLGHPTSTGLTVKGYVEGVWLPTCFARWEHATKQNVNNMVKAHVIPALGDMKLEDVRKWHIETVLAKMAEAGYSKRTGRFILTQLHSIFEDAIDNELIERNPTRKVKLPKMYEGERTQPFTLEEAKELDSIPGVEGIQLRLMVYCGLRPGELCALTPRSAKDGVLTVERSAFKTGQTKTTKNRKVRKLPIPERLAREVEDHAKTITSAFLFPSPRTGKNWHPHSLTEHLQRVVGDRVSKFTSRRCRTTVASHIEADIADVRELLGHGSIDMTLDHYRAPIMERQRAAVNRLEETVKKTLNSPDVSVKNDKCVENK